MMVSLVLGLVGQHLLTCYSRNPYEAVANFLKGLAAVRVEKTNDAILIWWNNRKTYEHDFLVIKDNSFWLRARADFSATKPLNYSHKPTATQLGGSCGSSFTRDASFASQIITHVKGCKVGS